MKKLLSGLLAATMACSLAACGGSNRAPSGSNSSAPAADDGKVYELKLSTTQTDTSMIYAGLKAAADKVAEDTNGKVKVTKIGRASCRERV